MGKTIMIMGSETHLGRKLIEIYLKGGYKVVAPVMTDQETMKESDNKNLLVIPWNRGSLVSAKTIFRETIRCFKKLDYAVIVNPEFAEGPDLNDRDTEEIDETLNTYVHGTVYLLKEILCYFNSEEKGFIAFAETMKGLSPSDPLSSLVSGAFHQLAEGILLSDTRCCVSTAFTSRLTEMEDYAQFIKGFSESEEPKINGEWLHFSERKSPFQSLPILKRK